MPIVVDCATDESIAPGELIEYMKEHHIDTADQTSMMEAAPILKKLGNNRHFLIELVVDELKDYRNVQDENGYGPQVLMVYAPNETNENFFVRACCWPSRSEQLMKTSGEKVFFYYRPHDHNFNFLTVGYFGPGYWSNYYTYDYDTTIGIEGESVGLKFVEKSHLEQGKLMLYRAFVDVHDQLPSDSFSVSLNIMENTNRAQVTDQYMFDVGRGTVEQFANRLGAGPLFNVTAVCGDDADRSILAYVAGHHASSRVRCLAWKALSDAAKTPQAAIEVLRSVSPAAPIMVRGWARQRIHGLEAACQDCA